MLYSFQSVFKSTYGILKAFQFLEEVLLTARNITAIPVAPATTTPPPVEVGRKGDISNLVRSHNCVSMIYCGLKNNTFKLFLRAHMLDILTESG